MKKEAISDDEILTILARIDTEPGLLDKLAIPDWLEDSILGSKSQEKSKRLEIIFEDCGMHYDFYEFLKQKNISYKLFEIQFRAVSAVTYAKSEKDNMKYLIFPEGYGEALDKMGILDDTIFHLRRKWLKDEHKLDAGIIYKMTQKHGYLDIRIPETHAIYWAEQGLLVDDSSVECMRMVFQSMQKMIMYGRLRAVDSRGFAIVGPNFETFKATEQAYLSAIKKSPKNNGMRSGYENYLKDACAMFWVWGLKTEAQSALDELKSSKKIKLQGGKPFSKRKEYQLSLSDFAIQLLVEDLDDGSDRQMLTILMGYATQFHISSVLGEVDRRVAILDMMKTIYKKYDDSLENERMKDRKRLPSLHMILIQAKAMMLVKRDLDPGIKRRLAQIDPVMGMDKQGNIVNKRGQIILPAGAGRMKIQRHKH